MLIAAVQGDLTWAAFLTLSMVVLTMGVLLPTIEAAGIDLFVLQGMTTRDITSWLPQHMAA